MNSPKVSLEEQIAYMGRRNEYAFGQNVSYPVEEAILSTLRSLASARDALEAGANALDGCRAIELPDGVEDQAQAYAHAEHLRSLAEMVNS